MNTCEVGEKFPAELMDDFFEMLLRENLTVGQHLGRFQIPYGIISLRQSHEAKKLPAPTNQEVREMIMFCLQDNDELVCAKNLSILKSKKKAHNCKFLSEMLCVFLTKQGGGIDSKVVLIRHPSQNHYGVEILDTGEVLQVWPAWERRISGKATID